MVKTKEFRGDGRKARGGWLRPARLIVLAAGLAVAVPALRAAEVAGVTLDESAPVADGYPPLMLNGAGVRSKFFIKVYVAGLYLTEKAATTDEVLALEGPKRVHMHFLYDEIEDQKIRSGWRDGYLANHSEAEYEALKTRIDQFNALFPTLKAGDVVYVDYIPDRGTAVVLNGETRGVVPGEDFYRATLKIWLGDEPVTRSLKQALLGQD